MHIFTQQLFNGLVQGCLYAFIALGYSIIYKVIGMINYAHGDVFMFGAFASLSTWLYLGSPESSLSLWLALPLMLVSSILINIIVVLVIERIAYRNISKRNVLAPLITSIGISIILQEVVRIRFPKGDKGLAYPSISSNNLSFLGVQFGIIHLVIIATALIGGVALWYIVHHTKFGIAMRAVSSDTEAASLVGVNVNSVVIGSFILGSIFASLGGVLYGLFLHQLTFNMGYIVGLKAFTAAVLGGVGILTALGGGVVLGVLEAMLIQYVGYIHGFSALSGGAWRDVWSFLILIATLVVLPSGLFSKTKLKNRV
jgi:branched-chain amino acid transport system permease protein